jgi:hypothetical protein
MNLAEFVMMATTPPPTPYTPNGKLIKVRTVTTFVTLSRGTPLDLSPIVKAVSFNAAATERLTAEGFEVQTTRVATNSFEDYIDVSDSAAALQSFRAIDDECKRLSIRLFNVGPASTAEGIALVPDIIKLGPRLSASGVIPDALDAQAATWLADTVLRIAAETEGGEGNFQFCVSCNVGPGTPFFPASYSGGGPISFGIGCETSAILADALPRAAGDLRKARELVRATFEAQMRPLEDLARELASSHDLLFAGLDASVAPLGSAPPLADAFASLGLGEFGESGTLAVSALVTGAVKSLSSSLTLCGYSGLMLPPCEDAGLARRASARGYSIHDLLMYSAVCGIGLDTVPVPGDVPPAKLTALFLDVAALAYRLDKPLSARLFPVPGKSAGEQTTFQNPFLCNTAVFKVP